MKSAAVPSHKLKPGQVPRKAALDGLRAMRGIYLRTRSRVLPRDFDCSRGKPQRPGLWGNGGGRTPLFLQTSASPGEGCGFPENESMYCAMGYAPDVGTGGGGRGPLPNFQRFEWELFESAWRGRGRPGKSTRRETALAGNAAISAISCRLSGDYPICCAGSRGSRPRHRCTSR